MMVCGALAVLLGVLCSGAFADEVNSTLMLLPYQQVAYPVPGSTGLDRDSFVTRSGSRFSIGGCDFVFAGVNVWQAPELASDTQVGRGNPKPGREHLANVMNEAVNSNLKVMRIWAHTVTSGRELWTAPGVANEEIFAGLDWILAEARARALKLIIAFADNWYDVGGVPQYASWGGGDFFSDAAVAAYKASITTLLNRVNTITGVAYKDDPTVMAWNLANELRAKNRDPRVMQSWIEDVCAHVKSIDGNHMVGIGQEGFTSKPLDDGNPAPWAANEGQDFVANHAVGCIDYVGFHVWPDDWDQTKEFQQKYIRKRIAAADALGKPTVLEEFGKVGPPSEKDPYILSAIEVVDEAIAAGSSLRGTLVWHLYDTGIGPGSYGIWADMSTFGIIREHAAKMDERSGC